MSHRRLFIVVLSLSGPAAFGRCATAQTPPAAPAAPTTTTAPDPPEAIREARRLAEEGLRRFKVGDYLEAITAYKASYLLVPAPGLLYNLAQTHRLLAQTRNAPEHCREAVSLYHQLQSGDVSAELRDLATLRLKEIEPCPAAAPVVIAAPAPAAIPPGSTADTVGVVLPAPPPTRRSSLGGRLPAVGAGVAAAALAATSYYFARQAQNDEARVSSLFDSGGAWNSEYGAIDQAGPRHQRYAIACAATSALLVGLAVWLGLRRLPGDSTEQRPR